MHVRTAMNRTDAKADWRTERLDGLRKDLGRTERRIALVNRYPRLLGWLWRHPELRRRRMHLQSQIEFVSREQTTQWDRFETLP
jgi:hypothetical protein